MAYEQSTFDGFKSNLSNGKYGSVAGARRAVGKIKMSAEEKEKALKLVDKHFGEGSAPVASKAKAEGAAPRKPGRPKKQVDAPAPAASKAKKTAGAKVGGDDPVLERLSKLNYRIGSERHYVEGIAQTRDLGADAAAVAKEARRAHAALAALADELHELTAGIKPDKGNGISTNTVVQHQADAD